MDTSTFAPINYLVTENPYNLQAPSSWWLKMLWDQDAELVVFPSRCRPAYILARRRHASNALAEMNTLDKNLLRNSAGMDGDILADRNLIYVRHLMGNTIRRPEIFQWLRDHDATAHGGGEAVAKAIETEEEFRARKQREKMIDDIDHRARDAYRSYQARTGRRSGYTKFRVGAKQMPVGSFTPNESTAATFCRD